jgi:coenzyme F420-reducing hydrogenase gamma subunit
VPTSAFRCGAILLIASASFAQSPQPNPASLTAEAIMARVAANQDRSEALRKQYVYKQQIPYGQKTCRARCPTHEPHVKHRLMINQAR